MMLQCSPSWLETALPYIGKAMAIGVPVLFIRELFRKERTTEEKAVEQIKEEPIYKEYLAVVEMYNKAMGEVYDNRQTA